METTTQAIDQNLGIALDVERHIKPQCESEPNPSLVASKRKQLRENELAWDVENGALRPDPSIQSWFQLMNK